MKKLLSILGTFGITATTSAAVIACADKVIFFSGSSDATIKLGDKYENEFGAFVTSIGNNDFDQKFNDFTNRLNEGINEHHTVIESIITLTSSDTEVVETEVNFPEATFKIKKPGKTTLNYSWTNLAGQETIAEIKWALELTVTESDF